MNYQSEDLVNTDLIQEAKIPKNKNFQNTFLAEMDQLLNLTNNMKTVFESEPKLNQYKLYSHVFLNASKKYRNYKSVRRLSFTV